MAVGLLLADRKTGSILSAGVVLHDLNSGETSLVTMPQKIETIHQIYLFLKQTFQTLTETEWRLIGNLASGNL